MKNKNKIITGVVFVILIGMLTFIFTNQKEEEKQAKSQKMEQKLKHDELKRQGTKQWSHRLKCRQYLEQLQKDFKNEGKSWYNDKEGYIETLKNQAERKKQDCPEMKDLYDRFIAMCNEEL